MSKKIRFEWVSSINDSEEYVDSYFGNKLAISYVYTKVPLDEVAKQVEIFKCIRKCE